MLTDSQSQMIDMYSRDFRAERTSLRRRPFIKIMELYMEAEDYARVVVYGTAVLQIPECDAEPIEDMFFTAHVHEMLYKAYDELGAHSSAQHHFDQCLSYDWNNPQYLHDIRFYHKLPKISILIEAKTIVPSLTAKDLNYPIENISIRTYSPSADLKKEMSLAQGEWVACISEGMNFEPNALILAYLMCQINGKKFATFEVEGEFKSKPFVMHKSLIPHLDDNMFMRSASIHAHQAKIITNAV